MILSLDLGTTGNRALVFNRQGHVVASSYRELNRTFPKLGWVEQDPLELISTLLACIQDVFSQCDPTQIQAIGLTNQRETTVCWDKRTGKPIYNAIVWQCRRTREQCEDLNSYASWIKAKTGLFLDPYFSATKIAWILKERQDLRQDVESGHILFGTVDTWVLWHLTGQTLHATDVSNASRTLLMNLQTCEYDPELLAFFNIPSSLLPSILSTRGLFGLTAKSVLGHEIPIMGVIGDQQSALFTQCGYDETRFKNTYGTGLFLCGVTGTTPCPSASLVTTVAWKCDQNVYYALEGSVFTGGSLMQWMRDALGFFSQTSDSEAMALSVPNNGGVYLVPALSGLGAPYWDPSAGGLIMGFTGGTSKSHLVRAGLESLAYQTADVILTFEQEFPDQHIQSLRVDGGAVQNSFLMQFQADILQRPVELPRITETTAFGAAGMAGIASGFWTESEFFALNVIEQCYFPMISSEERDTLYKPWKKAINRSLNWHA